MATSGKLRVDIMLDIEPSSRLEPPTPPDLALSQFPPNQCINHRFRVTSHF